MPAQEQKEAKKRELEERLIPISQGLVKLGKEFSADIFLVVNAPHLSLYNQLSQIQRLATVDRCANELKALRTDASVWLDVRLSEDDSK